MKNRFLKNTTWILSGNIIKMLISFIIGILTTRYLGPSNYGVINYIQSFTVFFTAIIGLGLNAIIVNELVNNRDREGSILGTAIFLRFIAGVICSISFVPIVILFGEADRTTIWIAIIQAIQLPFLCFDTVQYFYQSKLISKYSVIAQTIAYFTVSVYKTILLVTGRSVLWFAFASTLDIIVLALAYIFIYKKQSFPKWRFSREIAFRLIRTGIPFIVSSVMVVIYAQIDKVMIKTMIHSDYELGLYSAAIAVCSYYGFIPNAVIESARPIVLEAKLINNDLFNKRFGQTVAGVFWICVFFALSISLFAKPVIYILYGKEFFGAILCLRVAIWYTAFSYLGSVKSIWLIAEKKNNYVMIFSVLGAVSNIIINFLLIPIYGIVGAAIATLLTELLVNFIYPLCMKNTRSFAITAVNSILLKNIDIAECKKQFFDLLAKFFRRIK